MNIFFRHVKKQFDGFNNNEWKFLHDRLTIYRDDVRHQGVLSFHSSRFLHDKLKKQINKKSFWKHTCAFALNDVSIHVTVYSLSRQPRGIMHMLWVIAFMVYYCLQCKNNPNDTYSINITIVLSPYKKVFPENNQELTSYHVNSGVTAMYGAREKSEVVIFRREEVIKVLIHEMIHAMKLDIHSHLDTSDLKRYFGLPQDYHLNITETFTDSYACLLNVAIASLLSPLPTYKNFMSLLESEREFIVTQGSKVVSKLQLMLDEKGHLQPSQMVFQESTNVIAYYVLKSVVFANINVFLRLLTSPSWNFQLNNISFMDFLQRCILTTSFKIHDVRGMDFRNTSLKMSSIDTL